MICRDFRVKIYFELIQMVVRIFPSIMEEFCVSFKVYCTGFFVNKYYITFPGAEHLRIMSAEIHQVRITIIAKCVVDCKAHNALDVSLDLLFFVGKNNNIIDSINIMMVL